MAQSSREVCIAPLIRIIANNGGPGQYAMEYSALREREQINEGWNNAMANKTQATFLPMGEIMFHFPAFDMKLTGEENWIEWERNVKILLKGQSLDSLLDSNLLRPEYKPGDPVAQRWQYFSTSVAAWLLDHISVALYDKIMALPHKVQFADELWDALESASHTKGVYSDMKIWKAFTGVVAAKHDTLEIFIMEYLKAYGDVLDAGFKPDPYALALGFLAEVHVFNPVIADGVTRKIEVARWQYSSYRAYQYCVQMFLDIIGEVGLATTS